MSEATKLDLGTPSASSGQELTWLDEARPYSEFAQELLDTCLVNDPWFADRPIFSSAPLVLTPTLFSAINSVAERVGALFEELCQIVWAEPALLDSYFQLPPFYKLMWLSSGGAWHGFARLDLFLLRDGALKICEINADTPTGQVEAIVPSSLLASALPSHQNPNAHYEERFCEVVFQLCQVHRGQKPKHLGLIYPTDLSEDITLIRLYQQWFEARGVEVSLGSPQNLVPTADGGVALFGREVDVVLRHYKTDWWGERPPCLKDDEEIIDAEPLSTPLTALLQAEQAGRVTVVNPFGSVLPQNKLALAFFWEHNARFSAASQKTIDDCVPLTRRFDAMKKSDLKAEREQWVLKADYGCEGDEVMVGANVSQEDWDELVDRILPGIWIAQRVLDIQPLCDQAGKSWLPNFGPFLLGGRAEGLLLRLAEQGVTTGHDARVVSVFVGEESVGEDSDREESVGAATEPA